jgi:hypothetical protein
MNRTKKKQASENEANEIIQPYNFATIAYIDGKRYIAAPHATCLYAALSRASDPIGSA